MAAAFEPEHPTADCTARVPQKQVAKAHRRAPALSSFEERVTRAIKTHIRLPLLTLPSLAVIVLLCAESIADERTTQGGDNALSSQAIQDRLWEIWNANASSIITFHCKARLYVVSFPPGSGPTEQDAEDIFSATRPVDVWAKNLRATLSRFREADFGFWGIPIECFRESEKVKNVYFKAGSTEPDVEWIFNGKLSLKHSHSGNEVSIVDGQTGFGYYSDPHFAFLPLKRMPGEYSTVVGPNAMVELKSPQILIVAHRDTGFASLLKAYDAEHRVLMEKRSSFSIDDNPLFGSAVSEVHYDKSRAVRVRVFLVEQVETNKETSTRTFSTGLKAGEKLVDFRKDPKAPIVRVARAPYEDVMTFVDEAPGLQGRGRTVNRYLLVTAIVVSALAIIVLWKKGLIRRSPT